MWYYRATPKPGKSTTGQTPRTTRAQGDDDGDEDAEVDADEGDEKQSKDNKLAQWVRNTRKWVCVDDLGIDFSVNGYIDSHDSTLKKKKKKKKK